MPTPAPTAQPARRTRFARLAMRSALLLAGALPAAASAGAVLDRVQASGTVRVCIWPDYYGITWLDPRTQQLSGIDITLSAAFAQDLGVRLRYVDSSFPLLVDNLLGDHCDIAMHAVGVLPARAARLKFSRPYLQSDIYAITTRSGRIKAWDEIDRAGVQVAVQAGTFMEPVMAAALKNARLVVVKPPATREQALESGRVDVFMTDYPYSRRLLDNADWARLIAPPRPLHVLPYAYAVKPGDDAWLKRVDEFVTRVQRDGRLDAAARRFGLADILIRP